MLLSASKAINSNSSQSEPAVNLSLLHSHSRALCGLKNIERNEEAFILALIKVVTQSSIKKKERKKKQRMHNASSADESNADILDGSVWSSGEIRADQSHKADQLFTRCTLTQPCLRFINLYKKGRGNTRGRNPNNPEMGISLV